MKDSNRLQSEMRDRLAGELSDRRQVEDQELYELIDNAVMEEAKREYITLKEKMLLRSQLFAAFRKLDILQELIDDPEVTEIMVNGSRDIFIEKGGFMQKWNHSFEPASRLEDIIQMIVGKVNRIVNSSSPIADARLEDGSRVHIVLPPVALNGPVVTIRKFPKPLTMEDLLERGALSYEAAADLRKLVCAGYNIFISGGTGSGKTTFLNALSAYIPREDRVITIEDSAELQIRQLPNLVRLETRNANVEGEGAIQIGDLIRASLRMNPTRVIVGEVRGREALDMLQAMNTGHDGSLSTGHANSCKDMLSRLETMVLMAADLPLAAIRSQIASALDIMVHLGRLRDRSRRVLSISEVGGYGNGEIELRTLYRFDGRLHPQEVLKNREKLAAAGLEL